MYLHIHLYQGEPYWILSFQLNFSLLSHAKSSSYTTLSSPSSLPASVQALSSQWILPLQVSCDGTEDRLSHCSLTTSTVASHTRDAHIQCRTSEYYIVLSVAKWTSLANTVSGLVHFKTITELKWEWCCWRWLYWPSQQLLEKRAPNKFYLFFLLDMCTAHNHSCRY